PERRQPADLWRSRLLTIENNSFFFSSGEEKFDSGLMIGPEPDLLVNQAAGEVRIERLDAVKDIESHFNGRCIRHIENTRTKAEPRDRIGYGRDTGTEIVAHLRKRSHRQSEGIAVESEALFAADKINGHNG